MLHTVGLTIMGSFRLFNFNLTTITSMFVNRTFPLSVSLKNKTRTNCRGKEDGPLSTSSAYAVLGVQPDCSAAEIKAAFRSKVSTSIIEYLFTIFILFNSIQVSFSLIYYIGKTVPSRPQQRWKWNIFWCYDSPCNSSIPGTTWYLLLKLTLILFPIHYHTSYTA